MSHYADIHICIFICIIFYTHTYIITALDLILLLNITQCILLSQSILVYLEFISIKRYH